MPQDMQGRTAEEQLFRDLVNIVGADETKLASARGQDLQPTLDEEIKSLFPGLTKVASLTTMPLSEMLNDPNVVAGFNYELEKCADEWVPLAKQMLGLE